MHAKLYSWICRLLNATEVEILREAIYDVLEEIQDPSWITIAAPQTIKGRRLLAVSPRLLPVGPGCTPELCL